MTHVHCTVFLKESVRKTHFESFSAVSKAPEACELSWCAEFNALATTGTKTTRRAQKREIFDARDPRRAAATPNIHSDLYPTKRKKKEQTRK